MKKLFILTAMLCMANYMFATIILVDQNGAGQYSIIQAGINAAVAGDTVRVWPGTYQEQITLNKNILLDGSGYENTIITGTFNPTINISAGTIRWFLISSLGGNGINMSGGIIRNCVIKGCANIGIYSSTLTSYVQNCIVTNNTSVGIYGDGSNIFYITNTISYQNSSYGFYINNSANMQLNYCDGSLGDASWGTITSQGSIDADPLFTSNSDYHLSQNSPCWNTGNPSLNDPDGSVSDMGYFGGPDCPIYPVVYEIQIMPNGSSINFQAKGRANY